MKILQAIAGAPHGGAERFFERLVPALSRAGIEQRVLIRKDERRAALLREQGLEVHQLGFGGRFDGDSLCCFSWVWSTCATHNVYVVGSGGSTLDWAHQ